MAWGGWRFSSDLANDLGFGSVLTFLAIPAVDGQDDEADNRPSPPPFVADLLDITQAAVDPFHVIVGAHPLASRAVQGGDPLVELVGRPHGQRLGQVGIGQERAGLDQGRTPTTGLMRTLVGIDQAMDRAHKRPHGSQGRQRLEHLAEPAAFAAVAVLGSGDDPVPLFPDEVGLFFLGLAVAAAGALLGLARPTAAALAFALPTPLLAQSTQGVADVLVDVLEDMKDTPLLSRLGPNLGPHGRLEIRAVGDHNLGGETPLLEVVQEAAPLLRVVGPHQSEGHREIVEGVGGQQQGAVPEVNCVDAQGAGAVRQSPLAIGGPVGLADFPVEAIVEKALGEIAMEIALPGQAQPFDTHAVVEQAVEDRLAHAVGVFGAGLDSLQLGPEGLAAGTAGAVFSDLDFEHDDLALSAIANAADVNLLAASLPAAPGAGKGLRGARDAFQAHARLQGLHACVPPGLCA